MEAITRGFTEVSDKIADLQSCFEYADKGSDLENELLEKIRFLKHRKYFLKKYQIVLETRRKKIYASTQIEKKAETETEAQLKNKRKTFLADTEMEFQNVVSQLPSLSIFNVNNLRSSVPKNCYKSEKSGIEIYNELSDILDDFNEQSESENNKQLDSEQIKLLTDYKNDIATVINMAPSLNDFGIATLRNEITKETSKFAVTFTLQYVIKYLKQYKEVSIEKNFFHAAACSHYGIYFCTDYEDRYETLTNELLFKAKLPPKTHYPLSLTDVDRIIHSLQQPDPNGSSEVFIIFDTSLRIILTNLPEHLSETCYKYVLIYDAKTKHFAPLSEFADEFEAMCPKCQRFKLFHRCNRQCPICLRKSNSFRCFKRSPKSEPFICKKCNAFCQTKACYVTHLRVVHANDTEQNISKIQEDSVLYSLLVASLFDVSLQDLNDKMDELDRMPRPEKEKMKEKLLLEINIIQLSNLVDGCDRALQDNLSKTSNSYLSELFTCSKANLLGKITALQQELQDINKSIFNDAQPSTSRN